MESTQSEYEQPWGSGPGWQSQVSVSRGESVSAAGAPWAVNKSNKAHGIIHHK